MNIGFIEEEQIYEIPTSCDAIAPPHTLYFKL